MRKGLRKSENVEEDLSGWFQKGSCRLVIPPSEIAVRIRLSAPEVTGLTGKTFLRRR